MVDFKELLEHQELASRRNEKVITADCCGSATKRISLVQYIYKYNFTSLLVTALNSIAFKMTVP